MKKGTKLHSVVNFKCPCCQEGDFFIFPADIRHTAVPTPNSEIDRIVYAGNLCLDVENQVNYTTNPI